MKKITALFIAVMVMTSTLTAFAALNISFDGQVINVPDDMGKPFAQNNRTYVPVRFMLEYCGYDVTYSPAEKQVIGTDGQGGIFMMQIDNPLLFFKSAEMTQIQKITMDVTPIVDYSAGRIYIPASFLLKEMGYSVDYDKASSTVIIKSSEKTE